MEFFTRYSCSASPPTLIWRAAPRRGHAVRLTDGSGTASLCGRVLAPGDVEDRGQDFAALVFPGRCPVCAALVARHAPR